MSRPGLALALVACAACGACAASQPPQQQRVAVFDVELGKQTRIAVGGEAALAESVRALVASARSWPTVPPQELRAALAATSANRGRKGRARARGPRSCFDAPCQVQVGRKLKATKALAVRVEQNLLGQCDLYLALYDLERSGRDRRARARGGCEPAALLTSASAALCRALREDAAADGVALDEQDCAAGAGLLEIARRAAALRELRVPGVGGAALVALERKLAEEVLALKRAYDEFAARAPRRWAVAAVCRQGELYDLFAVRLEGARKGEAPTAVRRQGAAAVREHQKQMAQVLAGKLEPLRAGARSLYRECLKQAAQHAVQHAYLDEVRTRLKELEQSGGSGR